MENIDLLTEEWICSKPLSAKEKYGLVILCSTAGMVPYGAMSGSCNPKDMEFCPFLGGFGGKYLRYSIANLQYVTNRRISYEETIKRLIEIIENEKH